MKKIKFNLCLAAAVVLMTWCSFAQDKKSSPTAGREPATITTLKIEESPLNTVALVTPDGTRYKLIQVGDLLPKLYVNDRLTPANRLNDYAPVLEKLNHLLSEKQKEAGRQSDAVNSRQQQAIVNDLVKDGVVKSGKDVTSYRLTSGEFTVNYKKQSFAMFNRYAKKYINAGDKIYQFNYSSK